MVLTTVTLSCDDSDYPMDNWVDIPLQTMEPPAVFFNPHEINVTVGDTFAINLYALEVENVAGIQLRIHYLRENLDFLDPLNRAKARLHGKTLLAWLQE